MDLKELFFISLGTAVIVYFGGKLLLFSRMLFPKICFPVSKSFFTSMGEWAVVTGASEGIGRAYAFAMAEQGLNVVLMSRTKVKLDQVAKEIINNVGMLPSMIPCKFLETAELDQTILKVINCNVKTVAKMCKIVLPRMENRRKGVIVNVSSGTASLPFPMYTLYAATKVFVERFSQGLQAEYKSKGIIIQAVAPFGVSTRMTAYQETNMVTLTPEDFVKSSLQYIRAGDKTHGSICHIVMGWLLQIIPLKILYAEPLLYSLQDYVKKKVAQRECSF
ncbi:17-beta-hydroxysteroid dehydrogenase type 3 isoform X4 [Antennarius striatus]|uniref:17-beta-hydroxysteroid dehydrogenase type 3 isoform X4 n=1 Tax=Antennarius striatus TaxID=241820 RepID=UPI0035AEA055